MAGEIGRLWTRDIILGRKNILDASIQFHCSQAEVLEHINTHEILTNNSGDYESPDFYMGELLKLFKMLKDWLNYCVQTDKMRREDYKIALQMIKETRETLKALGEFQGRLDSKSNVTVNIEMINQKYLQITNLLMNEVCDECRLKVINLMDQLDEVKEIPAQ